MENTEPNDNQEEKTDMFELLNERQSLQRKRNGPLPQMDTKERIRQLIQDPQIERLLQNIDSRISTIFHSQYNTTKTTGILEEIFDQCAELEKRKNDEDVLPKLKELSQKLTRIENGDIE